MKKLIRKLLCMLGRHKWTWQHKDDALDALGYLMLGGLSQYERWRLQKRLHESIDYGFSQSMFCKHCGKVNCEH